MQIRRFHARIGVRKLYYMLEPFLLEHQIKMGRDALYDLLSANLMLVRRRIRKIQTTQSHHWLRKFPNLIKDFVPTAPNQLWVSDITYWKIETMNLYISFITDAYSHKIVGYHVGKTLESVETLQALKMALPDFLRSPESPFELIHHSDRGVQYCQRDYVNLLQEYKIRISMTQSGDPLDNPIAERINGIIKEEYLQDYTVDNLEDARKVLAFVVRLYNDERPHNSIGNLSPGYVHENNVQTNKLWKNYYRKKCTIVNTLQEQEITVNLIQD